MGSAIKPAIRDFLEATGAIPVIIAFLEKIPESLGVIGLIIITVGSPIWMIYRISKQKMGARHTIHTNSQNILIGNFLWSGYWIILFVPFAIRGAMLLDQNSPSLIAMIWIWIPLVIVLSWWMTIVEEK